MGLVRGIARTAVVAGTATAVSNRVSRRQANRWAGEDQGAPPPPGYQEAPPPAAQPVYQQPPPPPPQVVVMEAPPAGAEMDAKLAQLQQLGELKAQGILSAEEFEAQKQRILAS